MSYATLNNSFDGVSVLDTSKSKLSICACDSCPNFSTEKCTCDQHPGNKMNYILDANYRGLPESNDPLRCELNDFTCADNIIYSASQQPALREYPKQVKNLNNNFGLDLSPGFFKVDNGCGGKGYFTTFDARLIDQRGMRTVLDRPSYQGSIPLNFIYNKQYQGYGKDYRGYRDINSGQYQYYYDRSISDPYYQPVYTIRSDITARVFKDPMDSTKTYYDKVPTQNTLNNLSPYQTTRDALSFREDLMSKQTGLMNRNSWVNRWVSPAYSNNE